MTGLLSYIKGRRLTNEWPKIRTDGTPLDIMVDQTNELQLRAVRAQVVLNKKGMKPMDEYRQGASVHTRQNRIEKTENLLLKNGRTGKNTPFPASQRIE